MNVFLNFQRRFILEISTSSWLCSSETVLVRRHVRNKYKPLVEEADLIHATSQYTHIRFKNGRESTVSLRDVAPVPGPGSSNQLWHETIPPEPEAVIHDGSFSSENALPHEHDTLSPELLDEENKSLRRESNDDTPKASNDQDSDHVVLRRSKLMGKVPDQLAYYN